MDTSARGPARLALVGDRSPHVRAHQRIPGLLAALAGEGLPLDAYWIPTAEADGALRGFDGIWLLPGSPYRSMTGGMAAAQAAREGLIPYLGTCGGFQHALLEFTRNVCGASGAGHAEYSPDAADPVIVPLACSLAGRELAVRVTPGSLAERALGAERTVERYHCSYGLSPAYLSLIRGHGLLFSGQDDSGEVRIAELPGHPFFLATLFQPELAGDPRPHPIIRAFAAAVTAHAAGQEPAAAAGRLDQGAAGQVVAAATTPRS
jgi:CTP synthase (UTP-ammonia lyase)